MAKFMESTSSIKNSVKKKKKEDESAKKKTTKAASSKPKTQSSVSSKKAQTQKTVNRLSNKYAGGSTRNASKPKVTTTKPKATTTTTTAPKKATTTTSRNPRMQDAVVQSKPAQTTKRDTTPVSSQKSRQVQQNLQQKYGENKVNNTVKRDTTPVKSAADKAFEKQRNKVAVSRNPRMQDTARNTKVQSNAERQESLNTAKRAIRNTPTVAKESAKQVLQGHGKTAADVTAMNNSAAIGSKIDIKSPEFMRDIEKRREASTSTAKKTFKELAKAQDRSEQRLNNVTKNAKGLEKAYYGAVQAGTGILTDMAVGGGTQAGSLAAMGSRVYGNARGQAQREGATEDEDRRYAFMQAAKEVGTELMFPGVGLAGKAYGKRAALPLAERIANRATRNLTGKAADIAGAGIRLLGGTAEENIEEVAGWGLDPLIKEYTYGKNVRVRGTQNLMQQESNALRSNIRTREDADRAASYLNSQDFLDENIRQYMDAGLSQEQARKAALQMRDYLTASLTGNTQEMQRLESDIMKTVSNKKWTLADWDRNELVDTLMSTTLLTGVTGLPGAVTTSRIGHNVFNDPDVRKFFGDDAQKVVANEVINSSDETNSLRAQAMRDRLNSGKDLTGTQKYDLWRGYQQKTMATAEKQSASVDLAERNIARNNYVQPVTLDENGRWSRAVRNEYEYYQLGDETQRKYEENFDSALATAETLRASVKSEEDSETKSITETTEDRTRQAAAAVAALKDGYLTIGDVHEFGFGNTLARETLKAETGIDLNQYIVRNSDGTVNYAKTNEATENALFAIAADNMVKTAKAETETFIDHRKGEIDKDLMTRFGAEGQKAWKDINKSLDPRETARYLASANAASYMYAAGRNTTLDQNEAVRSMGNVFRTVDNNVLVKSFEAGRQDREIAMAPAVGQTVSANDSMAGTDTVSIPTGSLTMDEDMPRSIPDSEQQIYKALAEATGVNIHLASHLDLKDEEGNVIGQANGSSYGDTIILNVNSAAEQNLGYVFMHEMTHQIKKYAPAEYTKLENLIRDAWFEKDYAGMQREIRHKMDLYGSKATQNLSEADAFEEIVADAMAEAIDDPRFARAVCTEDVGMGKAILNSIRNALRSLRDMIANTVFKQDNNFHKNLLSYLDVLSEAESLWIRALNEATKARAAQAVNELQNQIYEQGRLSVGYHAGDLGKSRNDDYWGQGYSRGTGHFGFGTYFVGNKARLNNYNKRDGEQAPIETVDFDKYNLFKPRDFSQGLALHDALKVVDGFIEDYSELGMLDILNEKDAEKIHLMSWGIKHNLENYLWDEDDLDAKKVVDDFIEAMPESYKDTLDSKARQAYNDAQQRSTDEDYVREYLEQRYDLFGDYFTDSRDEYVAERLPREIESINRDKAVSLEEWKYRYAEDVIDDYTEQWDKEREKLSRLDWNLARALGYRHSSDEVRTALLNTEEIVRGYPENERGLDSAATVFMKQLGYEGVDVRHIDEMDDTQYGSVIYDLKGEDLARKNEIGTAKYSVSEMPSIDELDETNSIVENKNGDMIAEFQDDGSVQFSISSYDATGRDIYKKYLDKMVSNRELSRKEADDMLRELETIYNISKRFADSGEFAPFTAWSYANVITDAKGKPVFSAIKKNSEYKMNIDFSTICKKRRTLDAVFREMINRGMFEKLDLNKDESAAMVVNINNLIRQHKFEAACALCFVEARRYRQQQTATAFKDMWNDLVESIYPDKNKIAYFNFGEDSTVKDVPDGIHTMPDSELDLSHVKEIANAKNEDGKPLQTAEAKAARLILRDPSQRKLMRVGDMMASTGFENMKIQNPELEKVYNSKKGTGGAKSSFGDVQYLNEILKPRTFGRMSAYNVSGVRIQSFSDYVPRMVFDYVQVIADLAAKRLPAHGYTKEPLFAKQFGLTGAKINLSLVPDVVPDGVAPGLDSKGNYIWNEEGTFPYDEAMVLQKAEGYKENCGTIAVGISDEQIRKMLADPTIQMVIPYHKSSLNPIVAAMTNVDRFENYEPYQNTKDENGNAVKKDFKWDKKLFRLSHDSKGKMLPKEQWGNVQDLVKEYADWCKEKNYTPKFAQFLYMEDGSINPGYYKLLEDFALLDNDGNFKPQGDVQMRFPTESDAFGSMESLIKQGLTEDAELEAKRSAEIGTIVDEIEGLFNEGTLTEQSATSEKLAARMSISADLDEPYMAAVNSGNMEEAQRLVDEAAERAGYNTPRLYHGTPSFGFTTFDLGRGENIIFATSSPLTAETYSGETDRRNISDAASLNADDLYGESLLKEVSKYREKYKDYRLMTPAEQERLLDESRKDVESFARVASEFIDEHRDAFNAEKLEIANRIVDAINRISTAWADDMVDKAWDDLEDAVWDLKWMDESIQMELSQALQGNGSLLYAKNRVSDFMYAGDIYRNKDYESDYVFDNQLALELDADLHKGIYGLYGKSDNQLVIDANGANWNQIIPPDELELYGPQRTRSIAEAAKAKGYDSVLFKNLKDNGGETAYNGISDVYMFFNPNQVKSSDPVTYREDGSVIPLSERFDPTNNDIRYSLPTQDSDGSILSDGQMEYFKNSQARDENGRLVPAYHTTNEGGFTIFDPSYSYDRRSLFFASNWNVSQTYGRNASTPIDVNRGNRDVTLEEFLNMDGQKNTASLISSRLIDLRDRKTGALLYDGGDYLKAGELLEEWYNSKGKSQPDLRVLVPYQPNGGEDMLDYTGFVSWMNDIVEAQDLKQRGYYTCYLNLENPLIVDAKGANWNRISYDPYGNETAGITVQDAIEQIESADIADYGIKNIDVEFEYNDDGFPIAVSFDIGLLGIPNEEHWEWTNYVESDSFEPNVEEYTDNGVLDNAELSIAMWAWVEDKLRDYVSDGMIDMMEQTNIDVNGELHYESANKTGYDFIRGGDLVDVSEFTDNIDEASGKEYTVNTRDLAEIAENYGHDGVIIRNLMDIGGASSLKGGKALSDIYIAFSSNQVKDIRNENPTENPDIRWSVPEEEVKDRVAYTDAMDNSFEELEAYEAYISEHPDDVESYVAKHFDEETVAAFNSALVDYSGKMFDDKVLEDGRVRIAKSREDFYRSVNAKWRESWPTQGEVLNIDSVKANIRKLVRGVMANADANHQYKIDVANMTLADARTAFQFMKQGREEYAMNLLYHSAQRMVEGIQFVQDDTEFETYKDIRAFMRNSRVSIDEKYWGDVDYQKFRRENASRMKLIRGPQNVADVYSDLQDNWPWIFNEEERAKIGLGDSVPDLLLHIGHVLDQNLTPFMAAYSSEEATELCFDIADQLYDIIEAGRPIKSLADSLGKRDAQKLDKLYDQMEENAANAEREYNKSIEELTEKFDQQTKALKVRHDEAVRKVKANMAEMEEAKNAEIDKLRAEANDTFLLSKVAIARERAAKWQAIEEEKAKRAKETEKANMWRGRYKERVQKDVQGRKDKAEKRDHRKYFKSIEDDYDWLAKAVLDPTKDKYIPEAFRKSLADLLQLIDLQTENSKKLEEKYGRVSQSTLKLRELRDRLADLSTKKAADATNLFDIDAYLPYLMDAMAEKLDGQSIDAMDASDIKTFRILFKALRKNFQNLNRETADAKTAIALEKAEKIVAESMGKVKRDGLAKEYKGARAALNKINMTSLTPAYFFERMGTVNDIYRDLRRGFDTYIRNEKEITDKLTQILAPFYKKGRKISRGSDIEEWRDGRSAQKLELTYGPVTMTAAQRMSLLCLANRDQAMQHMMLGGIVVTPFEAGTRKEAIEAYTKGVNALGDKVVLSSTDIDTIRASLTPEQIKVATQLQQLMANDMANLGNEAHREMYGYEIFDDQDYFPIKSKDTWIPKDVNNMNDAVERIKSYGPAKPLDPNASNAIVIDDIFSVVADHCNGMNLYNAYLVPISNFMKVYNFTITLEDGTRKPVMDALEEAYGKDALKYIDNFIRDLNGIKNIHRGGLEDVMDSAIGRAKATAVAGNIRVAAQQPTAIVRAAAEMNPKYLTPFLKVRPEKGVLDEMYKYCPIAQWKSWGYYDTYMGRDIEDVMMNNWSVKDTVLTGAYGMLDNLTWGAIWQAVKQEQHDLHPNMDMKSEAFLRICGDRASEIFDKTQVVDSTFHRSDAMRSKDRFTKLFTAFMSEPTLTLNVFRAAVYNASEAWKAGDKTKAFGVMRKAVSVLLVQAAFVSVAQALADAWRGKDPGLPWDDDDDDEPDESYFTRFLHNMVYNMFDQLHLENNMYLVKDVTPYINYMISKGADYWDWNPTLRAVMGWDQDYLYSQNNLVFASFENASNGVAQIFKKLEKGEDYDKDWYDIMQKTFSGFGTALGIPVGTLMRDFKPLWEKIAASAFAADTVGDITNAMNNVGKKDDSKSSSKDSDASSSDSEGSWDDVYKQMEAEEEELAKLEEKAAKKAASASAGQKDEVLWDALTDGYTTKLKEGRMDYIDSLRDIYVRNGGREDVFDSKLLDGIKRSYKSTINAENTADQMEGQYDMQQFMLNHGITAEEISDMCYHSYTAKDLKAAMRLGNEEYMIDELVPLIQAGFSEEDFNKCWKQRYNYRNYTGKYTDPKYRISTGEYAWPITGTITSRFGGRKSPGGVGSTNHMGLDIAGSMGDPVHAADGGEVIYADWWYGGGNVVRIRHENGEVTEYMHLSGYNCKVGDHVGKGDQIGQVGSTGNSTGPHLHFGVMDKDGNHLDPEVILAQSSKG